MFEVGSSEFLKPGKSLKRPLKVNDTSYLVAESRSGKKQTSPSTYHILILDITYMQRERERERERERI